MFISLHFSYFLLLSCMILLNFTLVFEGLYA